MWEHAQRLACALWPRTAQEQVWQCVRHSGVRTKAIGLQLAMSTAWWIDCSALTWRKLTVRLRCFGCCCAFWSLMLQ